MAVFDGFILVFAFLVSASITPLVRDAARRRGLVDHALTSRKVHDAPVPRVGGVAIVLAFYAAVVLGLVSAPFDAALTAGTREGIGRTVAFLVGGAAIVLLGLYDDLKGADARQKFAVQFAVAALAWLAGFRIDVVANPFGEPIALGILSLPVTLLWIAGVVNAMNLVDGLDGLAGGIAIAAAAMTLAVSAQAGHVLAAVAAAALVGSIAGFLVYNVSPASIFMGDTGSMFLGYVLATTAIQHDPVTGEVPLVAFVVALGIPIADTLTAIARRATRGVPLFVADKEHLHHRLLAFGVGPRRVSLLLWSVAALLAGVGASLAGCGPATLLVAVGIAAVLGLDGLGGWQLQHPAAVLARRRQNVARRRAIRAAGARLRGARRIADLVEPLQAAGVALGARSIWLHLDAAGPGADGGALRFGPRNEVDAGFRTRHGLLGERPGAGTIEVAWDASRRELDRDAEIAIELLCDQVATALRQIERLPRNTAWLRDAARAGTADAAPGSLTSRP